MIERETPGRRPGPAKPWPSTETRERDRVRPEGLAQARRWAHESLPAQPDHGPTLRANPFPEVTDPICRLPLPTLFYRPEAVHLGDLLRIWVRLMRVHYLPRIFKVPPAHRTPQELRCFTPDKTLSPAKPIPGPRPYKEKTTLPRSSGRRLRVRLRYRDRYEGLNGSAVRFGNINQIPFRPRFCSNSVKSYAAFRTMDISPKS
jgi:hypothetical protein